jgi:ABC-type nickel/cobalt efflux system permease component RcnA
VIAVFGLDDRIAELGAGGGIAVAFLVALLLGLRHSTDPDHLTAVSTLVLGQRRGGRRAAAALGLSWGLGHAVTLIALGLPFVLWGDALPERFQRAAEIAIGVLIIALAVRLLVRWRRGYFHVHPHHHGELVHAHPHMHEHAHAHAAGHAPAHRHSHAEALGRTPLAAFGIGLVHGIGGSAGAGILLVGTIEDRATAAAALAVFAAATAAAMGLATITFAHVLSRDAVSLRLEPVVPVLGALGMLFGFWYALGSLEAVPYVF